MPWIVIIVKATIPTWQTGKQNPKITCKTSKSHPQPFENNACLLQRRVFLCPLSFPSQVPWLRLWTRGSHCTVSWFLGLSLSFLVHNVHYIHIWIHQDHVASLNSAKLRCGENLFSIMSLHFFLHCFNNLFSLSDSRSCSWGKKNLTPNFYNSCSSSLTIQYERVCFMAWTNLFVLSMLNDQNASGGHFYPLLLSLHEEIGTCPTRTATSPSQILAVCQDATQTSLPSWFFASFPEISQPPHRTTLEVTFSLVLFMPNFLSQILLVFSYSPLNCDL